MYTRPSRRVYLSMHIHPPAGVAKGGHAGGELIAASSGLTCIWNAASGGAGGSAAAVGGFGGGASDGVPVAPIPTHVAPEPGTAGVWSLVVVAVAPAPSHVAPEPGTTEMSAELAVALSL